MDAYLLYPDREWAYVDPYYDEQDIIQDLGLDTLFSCCSKEIVWKDGKIKEVREADRNLCDTVRRVMMVPLKSQEEIRYRQEIVRDFFEDEALIEALYQMSAEMVQDWRKKGQLMGKGGRNTPGYVITEIHILRLFVDSLTRIRALFREHREKLHSRGLLALMERLETEFSDDVQKNMNRILNQIRFYAGKAGEGELPDQRIEEKPHVVLGFQLVDGMKLCGLVLEEVDSVSRRYRNPGSALSRMQEYLALWKGTSFNVAAGPSMALEMDRLEFEVVRYVVSCCRPFYDSFSSFFTQLYQQAAFYRGILNLRRFLDRFDIKLCYPAVCDGGELHFAQLREPVLGIEHRILPVGNSCEIDGSRLLLVTGANQGGKSTFLRSIGIAQVMMQSGLPVAADRFESGIFPSLFTHFTRREDSAMNSGRLDEELNRMSRIVDHLNPDGGNLVLLNESFASTMEKEGSFIAYDITKALTGAGVKVLMVTHLLSFAQRVFWETEGGKKAGEAVFLSAERMQDGKRTYRMIRHAPELTSFGLDLYDQMIPGR